MALSFQTNSRYVKIAYSVGGAVSFTHMGWFYIPTIKFQTQGLLGCLASPAGGAEVNASGNLVFYAGNTTGSVTTTTPAPAGVWFHLAVVVIAAGSSNHTLFGYLNGNQIATVNDANAYSGGSEIDLPNASFATFGYVRDYRLWLRALTGTEVMQEYRSPVPAHKNPFILSAFDKDTFVNKGSANLKWTTVGGAATLIGVGGTNQGKRPPVRRRFP